MFLKQVFLDLYLLVGLSYRHILGTVSDRHACNHFIQLLGLEVALIFLTMHKNERFFNAALNLGVQGYVL